MCFFVKIGFLSKLSIIMSSKFQVYISGCLLLILLFTPRYSLYRFWKSINQSFHIEKNWNFVGGFAFGRFAFSDWGKLGAYSYELTLDMSLKFWHSSIPPNTKHLRVHSLVELWKILSAVWVHDDFKLLLRLASELHAKSQINE